MGKLLRYDPKTRIHKQVYQGELIGGFAIQTDGALLLFMAEAIRCWLQGELYAVNQPLPDHRGLRFNDAIADPKGRVLSGPLVMKGGIPECLSRVGWTAALGA